MIGYTYNFGEMGDNLTRVQRIDHDKKTNMCFRVSLADEQILNRAGRNVDSMVADMMDIGGAVLIADYCSPRRQEQTIIRVTLPVRNVETFQRQKIHENLRAALHYYTNDQWEFTFVPYDGIERRIAERQRHFFPCLQDEDNVHVALFSGGADALSGLAHQLVDNPNTFFSLITIGTHNNRMQGVQSVLADELRRSPYGNRIQNIFIDTPRKYDEKIPTNSDFRARAFVFLLIGCAFAILEKQHKLYVYENGIGAINLPFQASEVGLDHSRTVHPMSLWLVSKLVSEIIQADFCIDNPFFFCTKTEVCIGLKHAKLEYLFQHSVSCDTIGHSTHQCGKCSSCILRRVAASILSLQDAPYSLKKKLTHLRHMTRQIETIQQLLDNQDPWCTLAKKYPTTILDIDVARPHLMPNLTRSMLHRRVIELYERYEREWQLAISHFPPEEMMIGIDPNFIS